MLELLAGNENLTEGVALLRLALAAVMGGMLGVERTRKLRPAGLRTYMLVCIGACIVMLTSLLLFARLGHDSDPARMAAQVISGIGFIGAGTILVTPKNRIKGLTTAAGLWAAACLGLAIGCGFYLLALGAFAFLLTTMLFADKLELLYYARLRRVNLGLIISSLDKIKTISAAMEAQGVSLTSVEFSDALSNEGVSISCVARLERKIEHEEVIRMLLGLEGVLFAERLDL